MATAWLDERDAATLHLARGICRPLWIGRGQATRSSSPRRGRPSRSSRTPLRFGLLKREVGEGRLLRLVAGRVAAEERFRPDRSYRDEALPAVRAPDEGASCLERLAAIAAVADLA